MASTSLTSAWGVAIQRESATSSRERTGGGMDAEAAQEEILDGAAAYKAASQVFLVLGRVRSTASLSLVTVAP